MTSNSNPLADSYPNMAALAQYNALQLADNPAYSFLNNGEELSEQLTFSELDNIAKAIAANFQLVYDIPKGSRVILLFCPGLDFVKSLYACFYAGIVAVPVNPPGTGEQSWENFLSIVENAGASLILADKAKFNFLQRQFEVTKQKLQVRIADIADLDLSLANKFQAPETHSEDIALLQYTSGTTSLPKGVMVSHSNIMHNMKIINEQIYRGNNITVSWLPIYHDMGLFGAVLQAMYVCGHCILMPPSSFLMKPIRWLNAITKYQASVSGGPNFAFDLCVEAIDDSLLKNIDLSSWQIAASGAEPVLAPTLRRFGAKFFKCGFNPIAFVPCYGLAECTLLVCANKIDPKKPPTQIAVSKDQLAERMIQTVDKNTECKEFVSCGQPDKGQIIIVDTETNTLRQEDQVGEIWIRGQSVAQGYWDNPEQTQSVFDQRIGAESGFYRTGDLGFLHNGEIYISGRIKDLIIVRGKNHYPGDMEHSIQHSNADLVLDSGAVFAIKIDNTEKIIALQEVRQSALKTININQTIEAIKRTILKNHEIKLDGVMLLKPGRIFKTSSGKIRRSACGEAYLKGQFDSEQVGHWQSDTLISFLSGGPSPVKSKTAIQIEGKVSEESILKLLIEKVASEVGIEPSEINPDDEYHLLGLDSLDVVDMLSDIAGAFGFSEEDSLWECVTLRDLAKNIASEAEAA